MFQAYDSGNIPTKYGLKYGTFTYLHLLDPEIPIDNPRRIQRKCLPGEFQHDTAPDLWICLRLPSVDRPGAGEGEELCGNALLFWGVSLVMNQFLYFLYSVQTSCDDSESYDTRKPKYTCRGAFGCNWTWKSASCERNWAHLLVDGWSTSLFLNILLLDHQIDINHSSDINH